MNTGVLVAALVVVGAAMIVAAGALLRLARQIREARHDETSSGLLVLQSQLDALREQVRSSLEGGSAALDRRLEETNRVVNEVQRGLGEVDRQVRSVSEAARDLRGLQEMLRAPKIRGGVGEFLLADLLSQVLPPAHFSLQHAFAGGERVDAVIRVGNSLVPVDAKFPMDNFRRLSEASDDETRKAARRAFLQDVRRHVDAIAARYIRPGEGTYDFALMYIPAEAVFHEAVLREGEDHDLFQYAIVKRVIPVSPQSFYAYLQVILLGLRGLSIEGRAQEIMSRLGLVRTRLARFSESFEIAVRHVGNAQRQLEESGRRLERLDAALDELHSGAPSREEADVEAEGPAVGSRAEEPDQKWMARPK